ncbi:reverse transcriptase domain-containing protein [Tanacetum coccineum]|uniref:Reverse transcriptase domain-containing protein n=1 Tax=Tanacetum coccineum TaxID=301880 RepID=A0ABQ4WQI0_9ASTR
MPCSCDRRGMWDRRVSIGQTLNENSGLSTLEPLMEHIIEHCTGKCNHSIGNEMVRRGKTQVGNDIEFEINSNFIKDLRRKLFKGTDDKDAHEHVRMILEIADLFHFSGVTHDAVMIRVFPITLKGHALRWINRLPAGLVTTWDLLEKVFIKQYCPPFKTSKKLEIIHNFKQELDETLYHAWERYNDLMFKYPHHDLNCQ